MPPSRATRSSRSGEIRSTLADEIESGKLQPGTTLDERSLSERFGVSRTPIREALQQLASENLVHIAPRQGAVVAHMTIPELRATLELLGELEALCARFAARRASVENRRALEAASKRCEPKSGRPRSAEDYAAANVAFHEAIYRGACNPYLADQVLRIRRLIQRYRQNAFQTQREQQKSTSEHQRIAAAILAGDEDKAHAEMLRHVPVGTTGFSEFLSTLPSHLLVHEPVRVGDAA